MTTPIPQSAYLLANGTGTLYPTVILNRPPTPNDLNGPSGQKFQITQRWIDSANNYTEYMLVGFITTGGYYQANWQEISAGTQGINTINGDTGFVTGNSVSIQGNTTPASTGLTFTGNGANTTLDLGGTLVVPNGGTGETAFSPYAVVTGGTSSTTPLQNVSGVGSSGQVLTSSGVAALPIWTTPSPIFLEYVAPSAGSIILNIPTVTYYAFLLVVSTLFPSTNGDPIYAQASTDGGATYLATGYVSGLTGFPYNSTTAVNYNSTSQFMLAGAQHVPGAGNGLCGSLFFVTQGQSNGVVLNGTLTSIDTNSSTLINFTAGGQLGADSNVTNLKVTCPSGLIAFGGIGVYGFLT